MELRKEIEPRLDIAEKLYPQILKLILDYTDYCDEQGDEELVEYKRLEQHLHLLTGKEMSAFNLWEWWEESGAETLAFDISLPDPEKVDHISSEELSEIVRRLKTYEESEEGSNSFRSMFHIHLTFGNGYFDKFLKLNFKTYNPKLFQRNKDKNGNYFEYGITEITDILWNNGDYKA